MPMLDEEVENWIEQTVDEIMARYERAGTPVRGGAPIAEAMREAFRRGTRQQDRAEFLRAALIEIADSKSLTATPTQFYQHLQRIAHNALSEDARRHPS